MSVSAFAGYHDFRFESDNIKKDIVADLIGLFMIGVRLASTQPGIQLLTGIAVVRVASMLEDE